MVKLKNALTPVKPLTRCATQELYYECYSDLMPSECEADRVT